MAEVTGLPTAKAKTIKVTVQLEGKTVLDLDVFTVKADEIQHDVQAAVGKLLREGNGNPA